MKPQVRKLRRERQQSRFLRWSLRAFALVVAGSWWLGDFGVGGWLTPARTRNLERFLTEIRPWPLQQQEWDWQVAADWAADLWRTQGAEAVLATLAMSVVAMVLAGTAGALLSLPAARNFACPQPFLAGGRPPSRRTRLLWSLVVNLTRIVLVFIRSVPEYVWAFLFLALLGPTAWPLVLALALHNTGIMGKLAAEVIENTDRNGPAALRALGAGRLQLVLAAVFPLTLPRFLLYFFYRWETCVREATVLGMLGMGSLGFWIADARARNFYDEMIFFILAGALLVLAGDLVSALARRVVRGA